MKNGISIIFNINEFKRKTSINWIKWFFSLKNKNCKEVEKVKNTFQESKINNNNFDTWEKNGILCYFMVIILKLIFKNNFFNIFNFWLNIININSF